MQTLPVRQTRPLPDLSNAVPGAPAALISLEQVSKTFDQNDAVANVSFEVKEGEIFGIVGPSGCGKTTTVRMMTGVYLPTSGAVRVLGKVPANFNARDRERIGYMPQLFVLYPNLTVMENLRFAASMYGLPWVGRHRRLAEILEFVELTDARNTLAGNISGGMKRRLQLGSALIHRPELLFADEPTAGVDPVLRGRFWDHFKALKEGGNSMVVTTQYVSEIAYCDRVAVMREGELLTLNTPQGLRREALGGEMIALRVGVEDAVQAVQFLRRHPLVRRVAPLPGGEAGALAVYVDDAGSAMPEIIQAMGTDASLEMRSAQEYSPPFDEIFITLMERADQERGRRAGEASDA
jgi:ABC-2 type transport system ATP-binding protein